MTTDTYRDITRHPCFNAEVKGRFGRVHLPVAPRCNIQCNYCNRRYDCVNESRPGVTSSIITPKQALTYLDRVLEKEPRITVAGIAGPGDPFANSVATLETMRLIRRKYPDMILCLASNGMNLARHVPELAEIGLSHVTVTINAVDPEIGARIYAYVIDNKVIYRGILGAELLLARQIKAVELLKAHGITVKINTIVIPGINRNHVVDIAVRMNELGADLMNCMALYPNAGTPFGDIEEPCASEMEEIRAEVEQYIPQMRHCTRCRADAVGLLDDDRTGEMRGCLSVCASLTPSCPSSQLDRPYVAVATLEGVLVNQHLGEAERFQVWKRDDDGSFSLVEERPAPPPGGGELRWRNITRILSDCRAILVNDLGATPHKILTENGVKPVLMAGFIEHGLEAVYSGKGSWGLQARIRKCSSKGSCAGGGAGCG